MMKLQRSRGALWTVLALAACATMPWPEPAHEPHRWTRAAESALRIAQQGWGDAARFVACAVGDCPAPTRKTIAAAPPMVGAAPGTVVIEAGPSMDPIAPAPAPQAAQGAPANPPFESESTTLVITFAFGSAELQPADRYAITRAAEAARPIRQLNILGRTDAVGPPAVNEALALARANAVARHLLAAQPELSTKVRVESQGLCCYVAPNHDAAGRAKNRRVEIVFFRDGGDA